MGMAITLIVAPMGSENLSHCTCGDGHGLSTDGGSEQCDDANESNSDSCVAECQSAICGDQYVWNTDGGSEECDDGNSNNNDSCVAQCQSAECGDTYVWNTDGGSE